MKQDKAKHYKKVLDKYYIKKQMFIELLGGKCISCGEKNNLEFDHINKKDKKYTITNIISYKDETILEELKKCQLLCKSCHKEKTYIDNGKSEHGKLSMYRHHKCRCDKCRNIYNISRKKWRKTAREKGKIY
jgi:5-methylcytosine-specific restriction endonuclease McrA